MASHCNNNLSSTLEMARSEPARPITSSPMDNTSSDACFYMATGNEIEFDHFPAPPPPSPTYDTAQINQPIDELLLLSNSDIALRRQRSHSMLEADTNKHSSLSHHPASRNSPLRQVSSQMDVDILNGSGKESSSPARKSREGSLMFSSFNKRRITFPDPAGRERSSSVSSQGVSKASSRTASPSFNMSYLRSTIHGIPVTSRPSTPTGLHKPSQTAARPSLSGRHISSPVMSEPPASPTFFSSPRPVTPSTKQSRSASLSTSSSEARKEELKSYFSDSEDERKGRPSSKKGSSRGGSLGRSKQFRRRLSETFAFLSCGTE